MNGTTNYKNFLCVTQSQLVSQFFREKARDTLVMPTITQMKHLCGGRVSGVDWTLGWRRLLAPGSWPPLLPAPRTEEQVTERRQGAGQG